MGFDDLSPLNNSLPNLTVVTFDGILSNGGTVAQTFTLDGTFPVQTFAFNGNFINLTSVSWNQGVTVRQVHQFDNIVINEGTIDPIPEPATIALLGIGLVGLAGAEVRRRRKREKIT